jgi:hypothetical protein
MIRHMPTPCIDRALCTKVEQMPRDASMDDRRKEVMQFGSLLHGI